MPGLTAVPIAYIVLHFFAYGVGVVAHELSHWLVWRLAGRPARIDSLTRVSCERSGPPDRVDAAAALAPIGVAGVAVLAAVVSGRVLALSVATGAVIYLSRADIGLARAGLRA